MRQVPAVVGLLLLVVLLMSGGAMAMEKVYSVAVVPQFPARVIQQDWAPLLAEIEQRSGRRFKLLFFSSIPAFEKGFQAGEPDFAYMNPYHAVMARKAQGYRPLFREGRRQLIGILVVPRDSTYREVRELAGQTIAFPSPNALAASLYMRALLAEKEKVAIIPSYVKTHSNVYRHVLIGKAAAGGGVNKTLKKEPQSLQSALRVLYQTPGIAPHPVCVHPRVPESVAEQLLEATTALAGDEEGRAVLAKIAMPNPVRADYLRDYQPLEELGLENFLVVK